MSFRRRLDQLARVAGVAMVVLMSWAVPVERAQAQTPQVSISSGDNTALWVESGGGTYPDYWGIRSKDANDDGVFGWSMGPDNNSTGLTGRGEHGYGVYGFTEGAGQYAGYFAGPIFVSGGCTGCTASLVARNESAQLLQPGEAVQVVGADASLTPSSPILKVIGASPERPLLGVVLGKVQVVMLEASDDTQAGLHFGPVGGDVLPKDHLVVVVQGLARVRVEENTPIKAGDWTCLGPAGVTKLVARPGDLGEGGDEAVGTAKVAGGATVGMAVDSPDSEGMAWVLVGMGSPPRY